VKKIGMHGMQRDGGALQVQDEPKCSGFPDDQVPKKGGALEWNMTVHNRPWCLADPGEEGILQAFDNPQSKDDCGEGWQISSNSLRSAWDSNDAAATGKCAMLVPKGVSLHSEELSTATCPNIDGMWNIHYPFYPGILNYRAQIQVSGNVGTVTIEENDLVYHFAIHCHRIHFCVTPLVMPDDVSCTTVGTFFEGNLDRAGNTIRWEDDAYPQWTNAVPLHNKCPNMAYYACATGPLAELDHHKLPCSFAPDYNKCEELCKKQPLEAKCHFCSDGSCIEINQYII